MTSQRPTGLKLSLRGESQKVADTPETMDSLRMMLLGLYGSGSYRVKYTDEEGDLVTIASDEELRLAYELARGKSVLKLELDEDGEGKSVAASVFASFAATVKSAFRKGKTEVTKANLRRQFEKQLVKAEVSRMLGVPLPAQHDNTTCTLCKATPIIGVRYKCTVCPSTNLCELCEATTVHPHGLLKLRVPENRVEPPSLFRLLRGDTGPKMQLIGKQWDESVAVPGGCQLLLSWLVRNPGKDVWPEGTRVVHVRGGLFAPASEVPLIPPESEGEVAVFVTTPKSGGRVKGVFSMADKKGSRFGDELVAEVTVREELEQGWEEKVELLQAMGFCDRDAVVAALEAFGWDVSQAAEQLSS